MEYPYNILKYSRIRLEYSHYVIASFKYPFNAHVHTKYSKVCPPRAPYYRRFIVGPTLNNSEKEVEFFWKLSLDVVEIFEIFLDFFGNQN